MKEFLNEQNNDCIESQQKTNKNTTRVRKNPLSKYNFKEVDTDQSRKAGSFKSGSHSLAALHLFQNSKE